MKAALTKQAPKLPVKVMKAAERVAPDVKAKAVVLPGSLAVDTPESLQTWLRGFNGSRLVVPDEVEGVYWANDLAGAAQLARSLAEGQEIHQQSAKGVSAWMIVIYIFAALFALQLLFALLAMSIQTVID